MGCAMGIMEKRACGLLATWVLDMHSVFSTGA